MMYNRLWFL